jgi:hypothetical protein
MIPYLSYGHKIQINGNPYIMDGMSPTAYATATQKAIAYQSAVWSLLNDMENYANCDTVKALFKAIDKSPRYQITILPSDHLWPNAMAKFSPEIERNFARGQPATVGKDNAGRGDSVPIEYDPNDWVPRCVSLGPFKTQVRLSRIIDPTNQYQPDDVLFHELVHALRMLNGQLLARAVPAKSYRGLMMAPAFKSIEEFCAVLVTNMYVSEQGRGIYAIRLTHGDAAAGMFENFTNAGDYESASKYLTDGGIYYWVYKEEIDMLSQQMPAFTADLAKVKCDWNPFNLQARQKALGWDIEPTDLTYADRIGLPQLSSP